MTLLKEDTVRAGKAIRRVAAEKIIEMLKERFQNLDEEIFSLMKWCNPESWTDDKDYGIDEIREFASHFRVPLSSRAYDETKIRIKWRNFCHVSLNLSGKEARVLWKNILSYKRKGLPNICLLVELMYCLSGSNSAVERGFSILTMMLSDRRLKTSHDSMNFRIALKINDRNWSEKERSEILRQALEIYLSKSRRKRKIDEPSSNHTVELRSSKSESDSSDCESYNFSGKENSYNEQSDEDESL